MYEFFTYGRVLWINKNTMNIIKVIKTASIYKKKGSKNYFIKISKKGYRMVKFDQRNQYYKYYN